MSIDPRFYNTSKAVTFGSVARELGLEPCEALERDVTGLASFECAGSGDLCFLEDKALLNKEMAAWSQGVCLIGAALEGHVAHLPQFVPVAHPRELFFKIASKLFAPIFSETDREATVVHPSVQIGRGCRIGPRAAIGPNTRIGENAVIGPGVQIGSDCDIGAGASVRFSLLGNHVRLLAGARLGETGFGLLTGENGIEDVPHFGRVIVQDNVTIGANTCIDRGVLGDTVIGEGSKIDNLSHIGHNTQIGRGVVMAAYAGISGSVMIGDGARLGGRVGVIDHMTIGKGAQIAAGSTVFREVPAGAVWAGAPAKPIKIWQREILWLKRNAARRGQK